MTPRGVPKSIVVAGLVAFALLLGGRVTACAPSQSLAVPGPTASPGPSAAASPTAPKPPVPVRAAAAASRSGGGVGPVRGIKKYVGRGVALTFDDGPGPYTAQLLGMLRAQRVKATFCLVGTQVLQYPGLVAQMVRDGHTLCNHSWHHELNLGRQPLATIQANLARTNAAIRRAAPGAVVRFYRQPGGAWTPNVVAVAKDLGMTPLGWSVDPSDWRKPSASVITQRVLASSRRGSIILLHDGGGDRSATLVACRTIVPALKRRYPLVPLR